MHQETKRRWSAKTIVFMGFFVAMNIVLTRFCSIDLGPFRLGFGPAATIMSGLWLGPLAGGVVGMVADLIGCLIDGYAINPLITVSAILWGVVPGAMGLRLAKGSTKERPVESVRPSLLRRYCPPLSLTRREWYCLWDTVSMQSFRDV